MTRNRSAAVRLLAIGIIILATIGSVSAASFTPGNIVVYRVDGGGAALNGNGTAIFLDEYTPAGALVQSIAMPTTGTSGRVVASGSATADGFMTRSVDGRYLVVPGYDAAVGTAGITSSTTVPRIIGRVDATGAIDATSSYVDATSAGNLRSATSVDGTRYWTCGSTVGARTVVEGATTATTISTTAANMRQIAVFANQLYIGSGAGTVRMATVGSGTPITAGQTMTQLPGLPTATTAVNGFFFADLDGVAGLDTLYLADETSGQIQKWSLAAGTWTQKGSVAVATARGLTGSVSGTTVTLFATGGGAGTPIFSATDASGYNGTLSGTATTIVASAGTNKAFRGIALAPVSNPPTVSSINRANADPTNAASVDFTVTFSEAVTGVDSGDFSVAMTGVTTGASVTGVTGSGATYTVSVNTGTGSGTVGLNLVDDDSILNAALTPLGGAGAGNGNFTGQVYTIDKTAPTVQSILRVGAATTNAASVQYTVTFTEAVGGVDTGDFTITSSGVAGASVTGVTGSGSSYTVTVGTGSGSGTIRLDLLGGSATINDAVGNPLTADFTSGDVITIDKTAPAVQSSVRANTDPTGAATVGFTVTFTEPVTGVDTSDFSLTTTGVTGTSVTGVTGSGTTYSVTVNTGTGTSGTIRLDVNAGASIADAVGNTFGVAFTSGQFYTVDRTAPSVQTVVRANLSPTNAGSVAFTVTFSGDVTGVDSTDFQLTTTGVTGATVSTVTPVNASVYTVAVNSGTGDGTIRLDVLNNGSIQSTTAVPLTGGTFTTGEVYTIDKTAPTVLSITRVDATPTNASSVHFTVTFSESVTGVSASTFALAASGVTGASISGVTGSGTTYTVTVGTGTGDGTLGLNAVADPAVTDSATNAFATPFTGTVYTIDKTAPAVQSSVKASADPSSAATVDFTVTFTESVTGVDSADFTITAPGITGTSIANVTGSGTTYTVTVNTGSGNGSLRLDLTGNGTVVDGAGNSAASFTGGESYTMQGTPPAPTGLSAVPGNAHVALSWTAAAGATTYNVKRGTASGGPYTTLNPSVATTTYDDLTAVNGTPYFYVVSANGGRGSSGNSNEAPATPVAPAANTSGLVISQVYGGGGNAGSVFTNDFIEILNKGSQSVNVAGWSVQYISATGTGTWQTTPITGTILPGHYYLVQEGAGAGGTTPLPTPDATGAIAVAATAGKVALVNTTVPLTGCPSSPSTIADLVGFGTTANCFEGTGPTTAPSNTNAVFRALGGCTDTDNNAADFTAAVAAPRNSASPTGNCSGFAVTGSASPSAVNAGDISLLTATVTPGVSPASTGIVVTVDLTSIGGNATQTMFDNGTNGDITPGDNIFHYSATTAPATTAGVKSLAVTVGDAQLRTVGTTISLTINPSTISTIAEAKVDTTPADTVPDLLGQLVRIQGVVTSIDFRGGTGIEYYIQDATGGIDVFNTTTDFGAPYSIGANIEVVGTIAQFNGLTEITPSSIIAASGLPAVTAQTVTLSQLADGVGEPLEGKLVTINSVTITSGAFPASNASGNVTINDGTASGTMRIDSDTDIDGTTAPGGIFTLTGIVTQSDTTNPFNAGYQVLPRGLFDISTQTPPIGSGSASPSSVAPNATTLLTVHVTPGQNPTSTGISVTGDLTAIGGSASQTFFDDGTTGGDVSASDGTYSFTATVGGTTTLGSKSIPFTVSDTQARSSNGSISLNIQSANAPPAPTGLVATAGNLQVGLAWNTSTGATSYNVYRGTAVGGPYPTTVATNVGTTAFNDTTVANGTHYYYVVTALNAASDESGPSNEANALPAAPPPVGSLAKVYFIDIGQGASTLIVSPTGKTLLVDGGPPGQGTAKIIPTLNTLGIGTIDYSVLTHYHIDHDGGLAEVIAAGRVAGTAYDNGDDPTLQPPNFSTSPTSTYGAYATYVSAINAHSGTLTRQLATPGTVIDLGGGMRVTIMAQGGHLLSGGRVTIDNSDLNTESISLFVEYNNFDFLVSGDMTGGGSTDTAKTPDVETYVAQMVGDIDMLEFDHHGSTTANGRRFLKLLKAEAAEAEAGFTNTFGHPNRETFNKFLNTPDTNGNTYAGTALPNPGSGPVAYQTDPSPTSDDRCTLQGYSGASTSNAGAGTLLLKTDGTTSFTIESFDDAGVRVPANAHVYALDATGAGVTTNFPPTVQTSINPVIPLSSDTVTVSAAVFDREDAISSVTLNYAINGVTQTPATMSFSGGVYTATIAPQSDGTRVDYTVTGVAGGQSTSFSTGYFAGTTPISTLRVMDSLGSPLYWDYAARVQGVVTSGTGNFATGTNDDYLEDATGAINIWRTIQPTVPAVQPMNAGSIYSVAGLIGEASGRLRLEVTPPFVQPTTPYQITFVSSSSVPAPLVRTIAQINAGPESLEARLITISSCHITSGTIPSSPASIDGFLNISDGTGSFQLKIDHNTDIPGMATPGGTFVITGILQQDDFLRPFDSNYDIAPRSRVDLGGVSNSGPGLISIAGARIDVDAGGNSPGDYVPDLLNQTVHVQGVVTSINFRASNGSGIEYYIQDPTAGVDIFSTATTRSLNIGDSVDVIGTVKQFNGLTEFDPGATLSNLTVLAPGTLPAVTPQVVTLSQIGDSGIGEPLEGGLIRINNVTLTAPPATFAASTNYAISDSTGSCAACFRISPSSNLVGAAPPAGTFSVVGVLGQFDSLTPFDSGYQLFPRATTDLLPAVATPASITATAGTPQSAVVNTAFATALQATVRDGGNAPISNVNVAFTAPASGASGVFAGSTTVATDINGVATAPAFTANAAPGTYNVTATINSLTATFSLTNLAPTATHFSVSAPASVTAGATFNVTVTALDAGNATVTSYVGTVNFASSSAGALPADYTFVGGDSGTHTFSVMLTTDGNQTLDVTDAANSLTGSAPITVTPLPATHFSVSAPANATSGSAFNITVTALDASNATATGYTGTAHFTSTSAGTLPSDYTFTGGDNGVHTFSVTLTNTGSQTFTATDTVTGSIIGTSGSINVAAPAQVATHLGVSSPPNATSGTAFTITVTAFDASNATVAGYTGTVHFTSTSAGTFPANYTFTGADNGVHTFFVTLTNTGSQTVTATDTVTGSITGTSGSINVAAPTQVVTHLSVTAPGTNAPGFAFNITVTALDASNAIVTGYAGTVHFTSSSAGTLPADHTFVGGDNGTRTFSVTLTSPGSQTITATDTVTASITGSASTTGICPPILILATATNSGPACVGSSVNLFASGGGAGATFAWTGPGGFTSAQQNPTGITVAGTYTVTVSGPGPCIGSAQASTIVVINPIPVATITTGGTACASSTGNNASVADAGVGATYLWSITNGAITSGGGTPSIVYTAGASGSVHLTVTVSANSCGASSSADVVTSGPTITVPATLSACGPSLLTVPFTLTGNGPWTVQWSDGVTQSGIGSSSSSRTISATSSLTLSVVSVSDASCTSDGNGAAVIITISTQPAIVTQPAGQIVNPGDNATFTVAGSGQNLHYQWFVHHPSGVTSPVGTDAPSYSTNPEGNATWFVRVTNPCGSVDSNSVDALVVIPRHHPSH